MIKVAEHPKDVFARVIGHHVWRGECLVQGE